MLDTTAKVDLIFKYRIVFVRKIFCRDNEILSHEYKFVIDEDGDICLQIDGCKKQTHKISNSLEFLTALVKKKFIIVYFKNPSKDVKPIILYNYIVTHPYID